MQHLKKNKSNTKKADSFNNHFLDNAAAKKDMLAILKHQKQAHNKEGAPSYKTRLDRLSRCITMIQEHKNQIIEAQNHDFGSRDPKMTALTEIKSNIDTLKYAKKYLKSWMKAQPRHSMFPLDFLGARSQVRLQPKGSVGVISPWNFAVNLAISPLAGILAAGNRVMLKPSELTPQTSVLIKKMIESYFSKDEIAVFIGGPEIGASFSKLPFDHLLFTGGTAVGKQIMKAAAENLVPVTLELGGKSPVIIGKNCTIKETAFRIMTGKTMNAGQICLAPDYVNIPENKTADFIDACNDSVAELYPKLLDNPYYTSIINQRHFDRIEDLLTDAKQKGAKLIEINPQSEDFSKQNYLKIKPTLVLDVTDDMKIMQNEIFGPILPIRTYEHIEEVIDYINAHNRPLGLYYFGKNKKECDYVLNNTTSGGVTINDVIWHIGQEDLPFGGIGPSGMGCYHGYDGFLEFSHKKSVFKQTKANMIKLMKMIPPYQ